jgi:hypothetical protein
MLPNEIWNYEILKWTNIMSRINLRICSKLHYENDKYLICPWIKGTDTSTVLNGIEYNFLELAMNLLHDLDGLNCFYNNIMFDRIIGYITSLKQLFIYFSFAEGILYIGNATMLKIMPKVIVMGCIDKQIVQYLNDVNHEKEPLNEYIKKLIDDGKWSIIKEI